MIYSFTSKVRYSEIGQDREMSLYHLLASLQDCCTFHAEEVGVGLEWMEAHGLAWVLADLQMKIHRYPVFGETITVSTWAHGFRGFIGDRYFTIKAEDGSDIAAVKSEWILLSLKNGLPTRVMPDLTDAYGIHSEEQLEGDFGKRKVRLPKDAAGEKKEPFQVREYHLDTNHHVNNARYLQLAAGYLPVGAKPYSLRLEFKQQARLGDEIYPEVYPVEDGYMIALSNAVGEPYFLSELLSD